MFYSSALARVECVCGSKAMSSLTSPTSHTNSVKINSKQNLVCLTKKSFFDLSLTASTLGARSFIENQEKTMQNKLQVLQLTKENTNKIAGSNFLKPIQRHRKFLDSKNEGMP